MPHTLTVGAQTLDLSQPVVMTIINITPDSFYANSRTPQTESIRERVRTALQAGCAILDLGGYSSRPGADEVSPLEELRRLASALEVIRREAPQTPVSLDTFRAEVAARIIRDYGSCIINDITAGGADSQMFATAAELNVPYIAMHMRGTPQTMQQFTHYDNLLEEIRGYFTDATDRLKKAGVRQIVLDPGFGFAKTIDQNYELLAGMHEFSTLGYPLLAGISRKSMIYKPLDSTPAEVLSATSALHWECLQQGAAILRVHDTQEASEVIRLWQMFRKNS